ncbi:MAG: SpoIIIAH-like family protein [Lachnospiraceae bacterium]|nr:SpoIIIAH-like family protein [Lachnospiraceae bacterium]
MVKKNQIMITALAIMIMVAGYLNFAGNKITEEDIMSVTSDAVTTSSFDVATMFEITDEDMSSYLYGDIESMDSDVTIIEDFLDESMAESMNLSGHITTPNMGVLSSSKMMKEQTRAKNKDTLMEIINNVNISEEQKQDAVDRMINITNVAEKETAAEILLEAKGFRDVIVSITDTTVDVVVNDSELTEAKRAQIEDIIIRKTGVSPDTIIISAVEN